MLQPVGAGGVTHLLTAQLGYVGALRATFIGAAAIYAALGVYVLLVVRESVSVSARGQASFGGGRLGRILKEGNPLAMLHFLGTDRVLLTVAVVFSVSHFAMSGTSTIEKLYQEYLFSWEALQQGYVQSVSSVVSVGSKVVVLPVCVALFRERKAVAVIFTIAAAGYGCTAAAGGSGNDVRTPAGCRMSGRKEPQGRQLQAARTLVGWCSSCSQGLVANH